MDKYGNQIEVKKIGRGALLIKIKPKDNFYISFITAHLKSKLLTYPSTSGSPRFNPKNENERTQISGIALLKRTAEAVSLRVKANDILENNDGNALILLGDFNDVQDAATTQILEGPSGSRIGTRAFYHKDKGDDTRLFNLFPLINEDRRYSRIHKNRKELLDHILVSQEMLPGEPRRLPIVDSIVDYFNVLPSTSDNPNERKKEPCSDHSPVIAEFNL